AAGAQDIEDGVHANALRRARPAAAEAVRVRVDGEVYRNLRPQVIGDAPVVGYRTVVHDSNGGKRSAKRATSVAAGSCHSFLGVIRIGSKLYLCSDRKSRTSVNDVQAAGARA